jgi:hypothetical protein
MRSEHDVTRIVRSWLEHDGDGMPDHVLSALADRLPRTAQRRPISAAWRIPMTRTRYAVAGLTLIALLSLGAYAVGTGPPTMVTPTASPTPSVVPSASPWKPAVGQPFVAHQPYQFSIGSVDVGFGPMPLTWVQDGWRVAVSQADMTILTNANGTRSFGFAIVQDLYADPCHWTQGTVQPPPGQTADDLVGSMTDVLAGMTDFNHGVRGAMRLGGIPATPFWFGPASSSTWTAAGCDSGQTRFWTLPSGDGPVLDQAVTWILDVNGTRLLAWADPISLYSTADPDWEQFWSSIRLGTTGS